MSELEPLAKALRAELGTPPDAWSQAQRVRFKARLERKPRLWPVYRVVPIFATALALALVVGWFAFRQGPPEVEQTLVLSNTREPFRFEDGSTIALGPQGRGRLVVESAVVRFELQTGRASFDVTPGQRRTWLITAGKNEVKVVGTRFSVSYSPSQAFEVEVERGVVSVRVPERSASVELRAGDHLRGSPGRMEVAHGTTDGPSATSEARVAEEGERPGLEALPAASAPRLDRPSEPTVDAEWQRLYRSGKYAESLARLRTNGIADRLNELPARTLAEVADAARLGGDPDLAVRALNALMRRFPRSPEARDVKFLLGRVHALRGDSAAAISAFEAYLGPGGSRQYEIEAVGRLMELYSARGNDDRARAMARRYLESAPDGPYRRLARSLVQETK